MDKSRVFSTVQVKDLDHIPVATQRQVTWLDAKGICSRGYAAML
jgi:hypothetical protein